MRILQVIPFFSPKMGGSPQVVYQAASHLVKRGHQVTVIASTFGTESARFPEGSFQVELFPNLFARWGFYFSPGLYFWLRKHIRDFEIIHLHEVRTFQNIVARALAVKHKIPYVLSAHGTLPVIIERQGAKRIYDALFGKKILADAHKLIAVSTVEVSQYLKAGILESRVQTIYNGLNLNEFRDLPVKGSFRIQHKELGIRTKIILFMGRLHKTKGINHLLEAFSILHKDRNDLCLVIAGPDGGELDNLQALCKYLQLQEWVYFVGPLYAQDKLAAYVDADVLVLPAKYEIFGLVLFEAILCGAPVIVSDNCGTGQLISDVGAGYQVTYGNMPSLVEALELALNSPEENQRLVANGQKYIRENLDWNTIAECIEALYSEILSGETA